MSWQSNKSKYAPSITLVLLGLLIAPFRALSLEEGFAPSVTVNLLQDNNVYRTTDEISDSITSVAPTFVYNELYGKQAIKAQYKGDYAFFSDNSSLNYFNHDLLVMALLDHSYSLSSVFTAKYQNKIEQPGTTNALTSLLTEFNQRSIAELSSKVLYGAQKSKGQIVASYAQSKFRYENNNQEFRDYDREKIAGTFFYRIAPKTRFLLEANMVNLDYINNTNFDFSSKQKSYLAGVEWNATAVTSSVFKIGYQDVAYVNDVISDLSGLSYFLDMFWKPNTYSLVKIGASRAARESAEQSLGGFLSNEYDLDVEHEFTRRTKLSVSYQYIEYDFDNNQSRKNKSQNISITLKYQSKRWLQMHIGYEVIKRESTSQQYEFDARVVNAGLVMSFD
ncbi:MAG: outer membrane beta-barrel protein [Paraglaciecola sp.]|nr:outer membrane beta-barrel protein [Paraglaciecola sp.]